MSTDFYWLGDQPMVREVALPTGDVVTASINDQDPRVWIGTRLARKGGMRFSWVQDDVRVREVLGDNPERMVVVDEYGGRYTGRQFLELLACIPLHEVVRDTRSCVNGSR